MYVTLAQWNMVRNLPYEAAGKHCEIMWRARRAISKGIVMKVWNSNGTATKNCELVQALARCAMK